MDGLRLITRIQNSKGNILPWQVESLNKGIDPKKIFSENFLKTYPILNVKGFDFENRKLTADFIKRNSETFKDIETIRQSLFKERITKMLPGFGPAVIDDVIDQVQRKSFNKESDYHNILYSLSMFYFLNRANQQGRIAANFYEECDGSNAYITIVRQKNGTIELMRFDVDSRLVFSMLGVNGGSIIADQLRSILIKEPQRSESDLRKALGKMFDDARENGPRRQNLYDADAYHH